MGQKANPNSLRGYPSNYLGTPLWEQSQYNYTHRTIEKIIYACCKKSDVYLNDINISLSHDFILIDLDCSQLYSTPQKRKQSRRFKENTYDYRRKRIKESWRTILKKFYRTTRIIQEYTGYKTIKLKIRRLQAYSLGIPKPARQKTSYYTKGFNKGKFLYARSGIQLIYLTIRNKITPTCFATFVRDMLRTRSRRRNHNEILRFLKHCFDIFEPHMKIKGIKIALRGRFGHKPKARSKVWKYQLGTMPFSRFSSLIQARYKQIQTKLGTVGIKVWIHYHK